MSHLDFSEDKGVSKFRVKPKWRGFPSHLARRMALADPQDGKPHFICEDCKTAFDLSYMKIWPGTLTESERNLCRDCYKERTDY